MNKLMGLVLASAIGAVVLQGCGVPSDEEFSADFQKKRDLVAQVVTIQNGLNTEMTMAHKVGNIRARTRTARHHQENSEVWLTALGDYNHFFDSNKSRIESLQLEAGEAGSTRDISASAEAGILKLSALIDREHYVVELPPAPETPDLAGAKVRIHLDRPELVLNGTALVAGAPMDTVDPAVSSVLGYGDFMPALAASGSQTWVSYGDIIKVDLNLDTRTADGYTVVTSGPMTVTLVGSSAQVTVGEDTSQSDLVSRLGDPTATDPRGHFIDYERPKHQVRIHFAEGDDRLRSITISSKSAGP